MNRHNALLAFAWVVAWSAVMPYATAKADSLGRLFFTPEQRTQFEMERVRNMKLAAKKSAATPRKKSGQAGAEETYSALTVDGIVQKHGGPRTVWINGVAQNADSSGERAPESHAVVIPGKAQPARLKVGQKLLLEKPPQAELPQGKQEGRKPVAADDNDD